MGFFSYNEFPYPIREDLKIAYRDYWQKLASPGSWWTGEERIAIAREARNATSCNFCIKRKQALSPYTLMGEHDHNAGLSALAIDAVHRVVTDQNRITGEWVENNTADGLSEEHYVELVGIVVAVFSIDEFNRGLGLVLENLPSPVKGEPSGYRPAQAITGTGFVSMIPPEGAMGAEADLWKNGQTANVLRALSLVPDAVRDWYSIGSAQYLSIKGMANFVGQENRALNRMQMELIAGRVSSHNQCFY